MGEQLSLFERKDEEPQGPTAPAPLAPSSPLQQAIAAFAEYMRRAGMATNTVKSFLWDLSLVERYLGAETAIGEIATEDLRRFMEYLRHERGVPCSPKSYGRRLTTLKVFFGWLASSGVLPSDPAATLVHLPAPAASPVALSRDRVERALAAARSLLQDARNPDPRPLLLIRLLLQTGMKKSECLALQFSHFDLSDPTTPVVTIRYSDPRRHHKERRLALDPDFPELLRQYQRAYRLRDALFPCTGRNLEYVLHRVAQLAGLDEGLSFEILRWTCAVRDLTSGHDPEQLRRKLGLSKMAWEETLPKIQALAARPL